MSRRRPDGPIKEAYGIAAAPATATGSIKGHVRLQGKPPGNAVIRMGVDPMCAQLYAGKPAIQQSAVVSSDGRVASVFVKLEGSFPRTPVPSEPVTIAQRGCMYSPRVMGARVGQVLQIRNDDAMLHNVHSVSNEGNDFNVGQPGAGSVDRFTLKKEELMLRLACDVHRWMTAYVGVVSHPYFAVSGPDGSFEIAGVPPGTYVIRAWHEQFGTLTQKVHVDPAAAASVEFTYATAATSKR